MKDFFRRIRWWRSKVEIRTGRRSNRRRKNWHVPCLREAYTYQKVTKIFCDIGSRFEASWLVCVTMMSEMTIAVIVVSASCHHLTRADSGWSNISWFSRVTLPWLRGSTSVAPWCHKCSQVPVFPPSVWPSYSSSFDLGPSPSDSTEKLYHIRAYDFGVQFSFKVGPLEAILVVFGRGFLNFFWEFLEKYENDTTCAISQWRRKHVEIGHLASSNLTFLRIAIDKNGFCRLKEERQTYKMLPHFFIIFVWGLSYNLLKNTDDFTPFFRPHTSEQLRWRIWPTFPLNFLCNFLPLYFSIPLVQKSQKWPKTQMEGSCLKSESGSIMSKARIKRL